MSLIVKHQTGIVERKYTKLQKQKPLEINSFLVIFLWSMFTSFIVKHLTGIVKRKYA